MKTVEGEAVNYEQAPIKGEGDICVSIETRVRCKCDNCGEPATKKFSFCYINGRSNPASSMYGRDDCTYCSDASAFSCDECERDVRRVCCPEGMRWGTTFSFCDSTAHMFLQWKSRRYVVIGRTTEEEARYAFADAMLKARSA